MIRVMERHLTASTFVVREGASGAREILLLRHRKLGRWMIPGGHVEVNEDPSTAAVREVLEETGLAISLQSTGMTSDTGQVEDVTLVPAPAWVAVERIPATSTQPAHEHIDCLFVGVADDAGPALGHNTQWFRVDELPEQDMFPGTVRLASIVASATPTSFRSERLIARS